MPKPAARGKKKSKRVLSKPAFYYQAIMLHKPTGDLLLKVDWIKLFFLPPEFRLVEIQNDKIPTQFAECHLSRGMRKTAADMVCWVNKDSKKHVIQFLNGRWPFDPALNTDNEKIEVPPLGTSGWFRVHPSSGAPGLSVPYEYGVDVPPGPPGPVIVSDD